jgi:hypothetical protein
MQQRDKHASTTVELLLSKRVPVAMVTHATGEMGCCLSQGVTKRRELGQPVQLSSAREAEKRWRCSSVDSWELSSAL